MNTVKVDLDSLNAFDAALRAFFFSDRFKPAVIETTRRQLTGKLPLCVKLELNGAFDISIDAKRHGMVQPGMIVLPIGAASLPGATPATIDAMTRDEINVIETGTVRLDLQQRLFRLFGLEWGSPADERKLDHNCGICGAAVWSDDPIGLCSCEWPEHKIEEYSRIMDEIEKWRQNVH